MRIGAVISGKSEMKIAWISFGLREFSINHAEALAADHDSRLGRTTSHVRCRNDGACFAIVSNECEGEGKLVENPLPL